MFLDREYRIAQERRRDSLAWAEKERLIRQIRASTSSQATGQVDRRLLHPFVALRDGYQRWLARIGARLVRWGSRLQAGYADTLVAASAMQQECCGIESSTSRLVSQ